VPGFSRALGFVLFAAVFVTAGLATVSPAETAQADWPPPGADLAQALAISSPVPSAPAAPDVATTAADDTLPPVTVASGVDDLWHNAPVLVTLTATDTGSGVAYTEYKLDAADWVPGTQVTVPAPADHTGDGPHTLLFRSVDNAGNLEDPPGSVTVRIDTTPPATTAAGAQDATWYRAPLALTFSAATDTGSGVAYTEYKLDAADWVPGALLTVAAPADHSGDGLYTVLYRSADNAGNVEQAKSLSVGIDTVRPTTRAPEPAAAMRYRSASLAYKVIDTAPNAGTANITIKIKNGAGTVVKILTYDAKPVNTLLNATFACRLSKGSYSFFVYAVDAAGNTQTAVAGNRLKVTAPWSIRLPFRFRVSDVTLRDIDPSSYPLLKMGVVIPKVDTGVHDAQGVRMSLIDGVLFNHVTPQASYGLQNLVSYRLSDDPFYLARAEAQAQRLIDRRILVGAAWFHPNDFDWPLMTPPWYSAMGHGLSMALFGGLYDTTGKAVYLRAAQGTFASYLRRGPSSSPWIVSVDANGYLWLQEYPRANADPVLNGHMFSAFGLYDYYQLTHDKRALELFNGALTTVLHYASWFRQPGWRSYYRFSHDLVASQGYHRIHVKQFLILYRLTGITTFARLADAFRSDYPKPEISGSIRVVPGIYTGLRFDSSGRVVGRRTYRVTKALRLPAARRERIYHQPGYWFLTTSGPWTGLHLRERAGRVYLPGELHFLSYDPPRKLVLPAGHVYVGRTFDDGGAITATLQFSPESSTTATVRQRAIVNGADQVEVAGGPLAGYWLHLGPAVLR
jgi:hypothetical protein